MARNRRPVQVTDAKYDRMEALVEGILNGDHNLTGQFKEHLTTGDDSIFSFAHLVDTQILAMWPEEERVWQDIATVKSYPNFKTPTLYTVNEELQGFARPRTEPGKPGNVPPVVPESSLYPKFVFSGELLTSGGLQKRGAEFSLSWEKIIDDAENIVPQIPNLIRKSFLDAEEYEVFGSLIASSGDEQALQPGANLDGTTVVANAPLSREALAQAITQVSTRVIDGRRVRLNGGFTLVVPIGTGDQANFILNTLQLSEVRDGDLTFSASGYNPLSKITKVVESEYVTGLAWYLLPAKGSTLRPVLELMKLTGYETPEIRVANATGVSLGGGNIGPFEGSYDTDDASFRGRYPLKGANWTPELVVWSDGSGTP